VKGRVTEGGREGGGREGGREGDQNERPMKTTQEINQPTQLYNMSVCLYVSCGCVYSSIHPVNIN